MLCEIQLALSRISTRVAVSISFDDNHYTTGTSAVEYSKCGVYMVVKTSVFYKKFRGCCRRVEKVLFS